MNDFSQNQRRRFADEIYKLMRSNDKIVVITGDLGYRIWDQVRADFPDRFINVGAAEQLLIGVAVGMSLQGKIPVAFSITPFLLYRPFEFIRNYIDHEQIPVILAGSGRNKDYDHDGFTHWAEEDKKVLAIFNKINGFWPETADEISNKLPEIIESKKPYYINLKR